MLSYIKQLFKVNDYPIHIVAGNFSEFQDFVIKKRQMGFHFEYRYVSDTNSIRGLHRIRGLYIGTYKDRPDLPEIQEFIHIIKSQHNFYENNA
jgi:hypothetical protein